MFGLHNASLRREKRFEVDLLPVLLLSALILIGTTGTSLAAPKAPVVVVSGNGTGDFNCDGSGDQNEINKALAYVAANKSFTTVHLKGPFTYVISEPLLVGSNTTLEGDSSAVLKLANKAKWSTEKNMIQQRSSSGSNVVIQGFHIDGNAEGNPGISRGKGYHTLIYFKGYNNVKIKNMRMHGGYNDAVRIRSASNIEFCNNNVYNNGHEALYTLSCTNVSAHNNVIETRTNAALRASNCRKVKFFENRVTGAYTGGAGLQVQRDGGSVDEVEIYNNKIYKATQCGIWVANKGAVGRSAVGVHIHHNEIYDCGTEGDFPTGILVTGFYGTLIENNVIDGCYGSGIATKVLRASCAPPSPTGGSFVTIVRNNIITNSRPSKNTRWGKGIGIFNDMPKTHSYQLSHNCVYGNPGGNYVGVSASSTDIHVDPLFANRAQFDYHLKSKYGRWNGKSWVTDSVSSPCIDAGDRSSDYSKELANNGGRLNIGRYGNTDQASKSGAGGTSAAPKSSTQAAANSSTVDSSSPVTEDSVASSSQSGANASDAGEATGDSDAASADGLIDFRLREASPKRVIGNKPYIDVGELKGVGRYRNVLFFDLSDFDSSEQIQKATLSLTWYFPMTRLRKNNTIVEVYRPKEWDREFVSWTASKDDSAWKNRGGDWFDKYNVSQGTAPYASFVIKGDALPDNEAHALDVTQLVREYVGKKFKNTGFFIKARDEDDNYIAFYSSEGKDESKRPTLIIE